MKDTVDSPKQQDAITNTQIATAEETDIQLPELENFLYECADIIRDRVDRTDYKEYILPLVFYKTFNDTYQDNYEQVLEKKKDDGVSHEAAVKLAHDEAFHEVVMPRDYMWDDLLNADNPALAVDKALRKFQELNEQFTAIADLDDYADVEAFTKQENNRLDQLLRHLESRNLSRYRIPPDMLGEAYMDLVKHFAIEEGRDGGEFFTPPEIVELMVRLIEPYEKNTDIHDPTCGAGGMLVQVAQHLRQVQRVDEEHWRSVRFTGQEVNATVHAMAEMNLAIHDVEGEIRREDSLASPQFTDGENDLEEFKYVLANFPFSTSKWKSATKKRVEQFGDLDWSESLPHGNYGDFAFIMHMYSHLSDDGRLATVIPNGVLFRNGDQDYREYLIENDLVEAVIGLPENLFETTGIASGILVLNKDKPEKREGEVLFFNADHESRFYEDTGSDRYELLTPDQETKPVADIEDPKGIAEIKQLFDSWNDENHICRVISNDEIRRNEYNMNIALYVDTTEPEEDIDVKETLAEISRLDSEYSNLGDKLDTYMSQLNYKGGIDD